MSNLSKNCQKVVKKMSKGCQKIVNKKFGQKFVKNSSIICSFAPIVRRRRRRRRRLVAPRPGGDFVAPGKKRRYTVQRLLPLLFRSLYIYMQGDTKVLRTFVLSIPSILRRTKKNINARLKLRFWSLCGYVKKVNWGKKKILRGILFSQFSPKLSDTSYFFPILFGLTMGTGKNTNATKKSRFWSSFENT
jgi:hypothetical protein